jgi:hypothetical protein
MTTDDKQFLDDNRHHYVTLIKAFYLRSLSAEVRSRMQEIIGKYWQPGYHTDLWCGPCVSDMVKKVYRYYDDWIAEQPVTVNANFPLNKEGEESKIQE